MIRPYKKTDYNAVLEIYAEAKLDELRFEPGTYRLLPLEQDHQRYEALFESDIYVYEEVEVIGYAAHKDEEIRALFVYSKRRGEGVGKKLLEFLLSRIKAPASLYVAKHNQPAIQLYAQYGFAVQPEFQTFYNATPVMARKMIQVLE